MSQAEFKKRLKALMLRPENQICSDCPERQPRWASLIVPPPGAPPGSLPMGAFCCLECSGSHRRLGVHISFVRSVNLDQWKEKEVLAMENGGNGKVNAIFEARLTVNKPTTSASGSVRERFIRDKYERRKFYDPSAFERVSQMETAKEQEQVVSGVQRRLGRKPSETARKRVEERAARKGGGGGGGGSSRNVARAVKAPAPAAPAPAPPVDLLDFGDFESAEATSAVQASAVASSGSGGVANAAPASIEPQLDLFANMTTGNNPGGEANGQMQQQQQPGQPQQQRQAAMEQKKMTTADIMSMFNNPSAQHNPMQQNMFAMNGGMPNGMGGGMSVNSMAMMGQQQHMRGGGMNPNNMAMMNGVNPQQQMAMMNSMQMMQGNGMMGQQGMGGMASGNNMNMAMIGGQHGGMGNMSGRNGMLMQQQGQMPQMNGMMAANNNMMMMQGGGGMMQGVSQYGQPPMGGQAQPSPQKQEQFAEFGNFGR